MTSEYDLDCTNCGESLTKREVTAETLGLDSPDSLEVAECPGCGGRYFPETTLERLQT